MEMRRGAERTRYDLLLRLRRELLFPRNGRYIITSDAWGIACNTVYNTIGNKEIKVEDSAVPSKHGGLRTHRGESLYSEYVKMFEE